MLSNVLFLMLSCIIQISYSLNMLIFYIIKDYKLRKIKNNLLLYSINYYLIHYMVNLDRNLKTLFIIPLLYNNSKKWKISNVFPLLISNKLKGTDKISICFVVLSKINKLVELAL
jgi:hypothetical protein